MSPVEPSAELRQPLRVMCCDGLLLTTKSTPRIVAAHVRVCASHAVNSASASCLFANQVDARGSVAQTLEACARGRVIDRAAALACMP